jgi:glycerate-2-kinase
MGAMISTGAKNLADGPGFADRFSRQKRKSLARTFAGLYARMTRKHPVTRSVLLLSGGETKKPRRTRAVVPGAHWGKTPKPSKFSWRTAQTALLTNAV